MDEAVLSLLAEAVWSCPSAPWAKRAKALVPDLETHFTPPCSGDFRANPHCDEAHAHSLGCGDPTDPCELCGKTNGQHRIAWAALGYHY